MTELDDEIARLGRELEAALHELTQLREDFAGERVRSLKKELATLQSLTDDHEKHNARLELKLTGLEAEAKQLKAQLENA